MNRSYWVPALRGDDKKRARVTKEGRDGAGFPSPIICENSEEIGIMIAQL